MGDGMSGGSRLNMGVAIRILAALLLGCFMLPSFGVSGGAHSAEITGIALLTGAETGGGQRLPANLGMLFLLYIPVGLFAVWCVYKGKRQREAALLSVFFSATGLIGWAVVSVGILFYLGDSDVHFIVKSGLLCNLLGYVLVLILAAVSCITFRNRDLYISRMSLLGPGFRSRHVPEASGYSLCPNCRQPIRPGFAYCSQCGARATGRKL